MAQVHRRHPPFLERRHLPSFLEHRPLAVRLYLLRCSSAHLTVSKGPPNQHKFAPPLNSLSTFEDLLHTLLLLTYQRSVTLQLLASWYEYNRYFCDGEMMMDESHTSPTLLQYMIVVRRVLISIY